MNAAITAKLSTILACGLLASCGDTSSGVASKDAAQGQVRAAAMVEAMPVKEPSSNPAVSGAVTASPTSTATSWQFKRSWRIDQPEQVVKGATAYQGVDDISGAVDMTIDETGISFDVLVIDDQINTNADAKNFHNNDSVEIYLDIRDRRSRLRSNYERGVFQFAMIPGFGEQEDRYSFNHGNSGHRVTVPGTSSTSERLEMGYKVHIHFPHEGLAAIHGEIGESLNFSVGLNDADGGTRETQLMLAGTDENWQLAMDWQDVIIER